MGAEPLRVLQGGGSPQGWEKLWAKDVWGQTELPHGDLASMYAARSSSGLSGSPSRG